jgi:hypothetical protein
MYQSAIMKDIQTGSNAIAKIRIAERHWLYTRILVVHPEELVQVLVC